MRSLCVCSFRSVRSVSIKQLATFRLIVFRCQCDDLVCYFLLRKIFRMSASGLFLNDFLTFAFSTCSAYTVFFMKTVPPKSTQCCFFECLTTGLHMRC